MAGYGRTILLGPDLWVTLAVAAVLSFVLDEKTLVTASGLIGGAQAQVGTALLGVVVAGLAILVVFMDPDYIAVLEAVPPGVEADLFPFVWTALIAGLCAAAGVALIIVGSMPTTNSLLLRITFGVAVWMFFYLLWATFDLVLVLAASARNRILQVKSSQEAQRK